MIVAFARLRYGQRHWAPERNLNARGARVSEEIDSAHGGFAVGSYVAGYRLDEQIGRGGMAAVYLAHDSRLDRRVALKILAPEFADDPEFRQRFTRESRAAASVDHPHILPVFDAGAADGALYIAMRYVQGRDLRTLLGWYGTLPLDRVISIVTQVASALDAAHRHGLVHRDVKPANILLDSGTGSDHPDHVYLSDFGLAKMSLAATGLTSAGHFVGTLDYVAPEQIEGHAVDGRADLYGLACAAYEMLCGAPPFKRDQGEGLSVLWAQLSEAPAPPTAHRPDLPAAIDHVMAKALAKSPDDRHRNCLDFAASLRHASRGAPGADHSADEGWMLSPASPSATAPHRVPDLAGHAGLAALADAATGHDGPRGWEFPERATDAAWRTETQLAAPGDPAVPTWGDDPPIPPAGRDRTDQFEAPGLGAPYDHRPDHDGQARSRLRWTRRMAVPIACVAALALAGGVVAVTIGGGSPAGVTRTHHAQVPSIGTSSPHVRTSPAKPAPPPQQVVPVAPAATATTPMPSPTVSPTVSPTPSPTVSATASPTISPTVSPTGTPTHGPMSSPPTHKP